MRRSAIERCEMTIFRPKRRRYYIARWTDPETQERRERSLRTHLKREAWQRGAELADKIVEGIAIDDMTWLEFCKRYEASHLSKKSPASLQSWNRVKMSVEAVLNSPRLSQVRGRRILDWQASLWDEGLAPNSVASYSARLRAALNWARKVDLLTRTPYVAVEWEEVPRSRGITEVEFCLILDAVPEVRKKDAKHWERLLHGLSRTNLRIGELIALSWDADAPIRIERVSGYPMVRMAPKSHKSRKIRLQVITPEFWAACCDTPAADRHGPVFPIPNGRGGQMSRKRVIRNIAAIGEAAGVVTNADTHKMATSHDIGKRTFVRQVDARLTQPEVHKAMGHKSFQTTSTFYDTRQATELAAKLFSQEHDNGDPQAD